MKKNYLFVALCLLLLSSTLKSQWTEETNFNQVVSGLQTFNGEIYIGGNFTQRNSGTCYWSAIFDGSTFVNHTTMIGGGGISKMEVFNGELYATGSLNIGSTAGVYKWTGTTWNSASSYTTSHTGIYADGNDLYVGGDFGTIGKKTGTGPFTPMPALDNSNDKVKAINKYNGEIIIAGTINDYNSVALNNIARWDGTAWQPTGTGLDGEVKCLAVFNGELYVGGSFANAGGSPAKYIAKWNGTNWSNVGGSMTGVGYNGIRDMIVYNNMLFVVGDFTEMGGTPTKNVAMWNGVSWVSLDLTTTSNFANCVEVLNNRLYVGTFDFTSSSLYSIDLNVVGIEEGIETTHSELYVYPNPSNGIFNINLINNSDNVATIEVFNALGDIVLSNSINSNRIKVDIQNQQKGIYLIKVNVGNKIFYEKVVHQ